MSASTTHAGQPGDLDGSKTPAGKVVAEFIELMWNQRQPQAAFDKYVSKTDYRHRYGPNATVTENALRSGYAEELDRETRALGMLPEGRKFLIKKLLVQGDQVFVETHVVGGKPDAGLLVWIVYRVKNGKIVEHAHLFGELTSEAMAEHAFK